MKETLFIIALVAITPPVFASAKKIEIKKPEPAGIPAVVQKAATKMQLDDVRTIITAVKNEDGNPCMPEGTSYSAELQVKQAEFNGEKSSVEYKWETVKTINISGKGEVMEACNE
jgi:hypothetical protein